MAGPFNAKDAQGGNKQANIAFVKAKASITGTCSLPTSAYCDPSFPKIVQR